MLQSRLLIILLLCSSLGVLAETRTIHVFVALCDNEHQGIVPVPASIGNGKDIRNNLYWGAGYGVKSFFKIKTEDWVLVQTIKPEQSFILERVLFKHATEDAYLLADAYDGEQIKPCIQQFLSAANGAKTVSIEANGRLLEFGGGAGLVAYVGHNGLMEFDAGMDYSTTDKHLDAIVLACYSKSYFERELKAAGAMPILWTTHLMAPEAYTLKAALDGWLKNESGALIEERAAQAYNRYQKCGIKGARNLFTTGY